MTLLVIGGTNYGNQKTGSSRVDSYSLLGENITYTGRRADMPHQMAWHVSVVLDGIVYVASGTNGKPASRYHPDLNRWDKLEDLNTFRSFSPCGFITKGRFYVAGGYLTTTLRQNGKNLASIESLAVDDTNSGWRYESVSLPSPNYSGACIIVNDTVYHAGGWRYSYRKDVIHWTVGSKAWTHKTNMIETRGYHCMVTDGVDRMWVIGGYLISSIQEYTISSNTWKNLSLMKRPLWSMGCVYYQGKIFVFGGLIGNTWATPGNDEIVIYSVDDDTWITSPTKLEQSIGAHTVVLV